MLVIDGNTAEGLVSPEWAIALAEAALRKTSNGVARQDIRRVVPVPGAVGACLSVMPAALTDHGRFGAKVQSVMPDNFEHGMPSHQGGVLLFDQHRGTPLALISAHAITGLRTAAASAVATRLLAAPLAGRLALIGYGEQAARHIETLSRVRDLTEIRVWGRDPARAAAFAARRGGRAFATAQEAVEGADIVCTVTAAEHPVLRGAWLQPGTHVNAVGASVRTLRELDTDCVRRARVWVDYMPLAMDSAADLIEPLREGAIPESHIAGEIGAALNGTIPAREGAAQITIYRSLGVPAQDIEFANAIYDRAVALGLGTPVAF